MRALHVSALSPDLSGVRLAEIAVPTPAAGQVLVQVQAGAIGFPDLLMTQGRYQSKPSLPFVGGMEAAGIVAAVGPGVDDVAIGDPVLGLGQGGFADYAVYPAEKIFAKPPCLSFERAASLGTAYLTAYVALVRSAKLVAGETLLVHGGAGGVGLAAVDLGVALGARVIAVASSVQKRATLVALHPSVMVLEPRDFRDAVKAATHDRGADVIFDPVGGDIFIESTRCIAFDGRLLIVGFASGTPANLATNIALIKGFSAIGVRAGEYGRRFPGKGAENLAAILELARNGRIKPHVHAALSIDEWREGFHMLANREAVGRIVLRPGG
uniref:Alcohol dehydrogenase, zinc-containing n=1 Tax=Sphingomonas sp. JE1 TaxID=1628059 RepID=A0A0D4ZZR0_9SPHN|nr:MULTISPECIES: NADPH:quinone oxidoreductase family protein [unclassified Sphingomonas]AJW29525.1 alcohol dehydrogenase, zinc-containing [Sphingomonas sp. JE1]